MTASSTTPWETVARRAADAASEASYSATRCEGMFVKLSEKLNEHVTECRRLRARQIVPDVPNVDDLEPDEITQHGTRRYKFKNRAGQEVVFTHDEIETVRNANAIVREAKRYAWRHAIPWLLAGGLGVWHLVRTFLGHG